MGGCRGGGGWWCMGGMSWRGRGSGDVGGGGGEVGKGRWGAGGRLEGGNECLGDSSRESVYIDALSSREKCTQ